MFEIVKDLGTKDLLCALRSDFFIMHAYIQGLIQIEMLKAIERMTGKSISELFDWVVGTSTGGILALGMIYGTVRMLT